MMFNVFRLVRGKFRRHLRMGFAETAGRFNFMFRVFAVVTVIRGFDGCGGGFNRFRCGRNFFGRGCFAGFRRGARATAAATSTPTAATAVAGIPGGGGRV